MKTFTRDSTVRLTVTFYDTAGAVLNPASANVTLTYRVEGLRTTATYAMSQSGTEWIYEWDSSVSDLGVVEGHAMSGDGVPTASVDFEFRLSGNKANLDADGD